MARKRETHDRSSLRRGLIPAFPELGGIDDVAKGRWDCQDAMRMGDSEGFQRREISFTLCGHLAVAAPSKRRRVQVVRLTEAFNRFKRCAGNEDARRPRMRGYSSLTSRPRFFADLKTSWKIAIAIAK